MKVIRDYKELCHNNTIRNNTNDEYQPCSKFISSYISSLVYSQSRTDIQFVQGPMQPMNPASERAGCRCFTLVLGKGHHHVDTTCWWRCFPLGDNVLQTLVGFNYVEPWWPWYNQSLHTRTHTQPTRDSDEVVFAANL